MKKNMRNSYAFTLVELIVVITILAVLGTLGFMSFQGYAKTSRDTVRVSDLKLIEKALEFEITKNDILPYPDNYITLTASGTILGYQGNAGTESLGRIGISDKVLDPKDETEYTYSTNESRTKYQLLGFLEAELSQNIYTQSYADFSTRIPLLKGTELGILVDEVTNIPVQGLGIDIDVQNTISNYGLFLNNREQKYSGTGEVLMEGILPNKISDNYNSCKDILDNNDITQGVNGVYKINVKNIPIFVYCDMTTNNGGWTPIFNLSEQSVLWNSGDDLITNIIGTSCNTWNTNCLSLTYNYIPLGNDVMIEGANTNIIKDNATTHFIINNISSGKNKTVYEILNDTNNDEDCKYPLGRVDVLLKRDSGIVSGLDLNNMTNINGSTWCMNDRQAGVSTEKVFILARSGGNAAGWPSRVYGGHAHNNYRFWTR